MPGARAPPSPGLGCADVAAATAPPQRREPLELLGVCGADSRVNASLDGPAPVELDAAAVRVAHEADGLVPPTRIDVALVHVLRFDEVVVRVVDPEGQRLAHGRG